MSKEIAVDFEELQGKTFVDLFVNNRKDEVVFVTKTGTTYRMYHEQDCCEYVRIEEVIGDLNDLLNNEILYAVKSSNSGYESEIYTFTWTFYKLATINGWVDFRWYGSSNGYYSEDVSLYKVVKE